MRQLERLGARLLAGPARSEYTSDYEITISVMLVFSGLCCLAGAWWLHKERANGPVAVVLAAAAGPSAAQPPAYATAVTTMTGYCTQNAA